MIEDRPLAVCDYRSMVPSDLIVADRIFPHDDFELYFVKHNANQSWHWLSKQTPEEVTLILMYDTSAEHARFCAHGSFENPLASASAPPRESVETRSVVISRAVDI